MLTFEGPLTVLTFVTSDPCYHVDRSWANSTVLDILAPVLEYRDCQATCRVRSQDDIWIQFLKYFPSEESLECEGWTWTTENNTVLKLSVTTVL